MVVKADGSDTVWDEGFKKMVRTGMTESAITNASISIDAACLVFAQSILDDCAWSYLKVCSLAAPADWDPVISAKKVDFNAVQGKSPDEIRTQLIDEKLAQLQWEGLLTKTDLLFRLCSPPVGYSPINDYVFDQDRLKSIDEARHGIIHRDGLGKPIENIKDDLRYIEKTSNFLMALVNQKYGVQLNVLRVFNIPTPRQQQ